MYKKIVGVGKKILNLRKDGFSYGEIAKKLGISKSHVAYYAKGTKLTAAQLLKKMRAGRDKGGGRRPWEPSQISSLFKMFGKDDLDSMSKGKAAEAAVKLRLSLLGIEVFDGSGGESIDFAIARPRGDKLLRVQIRWAHKASVGAPSVRLRCSNGRRSLKRYDEGTFDFLMGYDFITDSVHVWHADEIANRCASVSTCEQSFEAWDKVVSRL